MFWYLPTFCFWHHILFVYLDTQERLFLILCMLKRKSNTRRKTILLSEQVGGTVRKSIMRQSKSHLISHTKSGFFEKILQSRILFYCMIFPLALFLYRDLLGHFFFADDFAFLHVAANKTLTTGILQRLFPVKRPVPYASKNRAAFCWRYPSPTTLT